MLICPKKTNGIKANNNKSDFAILFVRLFVYNHNSATERIKHLQHLFHSRSATVNKKASNLTVRCQNKNVTLKKRIIQCKDSHFPLIKETPE